MDPVLAGSDFRLVYVGCQSTTMVVIGSPSSSGSGASTTRKVNGYSWPC